MLFDIPNLRRPERHFPPRLSHITAETKTLEISRDVVPRKVPEAFREAKDAESEPQRRLCGRYASHRPDLYAEMLDAQYLLSSSFFCAIFPLSREQKTLCKLGVEVEPVGFVGRDNISEGANVLIFSEHGATTVLRRVLFARLLRESRPMHGSQCISPARSLCG